MLTVDDAFTPDAILQVRSLFQEYAASLEVDLSFQGFEQELSALPGEYARPHGRLLVARWNSEVAGCVALRRMDPMVCEMKRLYVRPAYRAHGMGRALLLRIIAEAKAAGYRTMRLDSLPSMAAAQALYRRLGFREIPPYRRNPVEGTVFLELPLLEEAS
jgi:ribosomal protein S18 acetylase RimI-like enzyme